MDRPETRPAFTMPPSGWYPDPAGGPAERYWDGVRWTVHARPWQGHCQASPVQQGCYATDQQRVYLPGGATTCIRQQHPDYAHRVWRCFASLIDLLAILMGFILAIIPFGLMESGPFHRMTRSDQDAVAIGVLLAALVFGFLYNVLMLRFLGGTLGKMAVGLWVVPENDLQAGHARWGNIVVRQLVFSALLVTVVGAFVDFLFPLFQDKRQTVHDSLGGTVVLRKR